MLNIFCHRRWLVFGFIGSCVMPFTVMAQGGWSLQDSIRRVVAQAPEMQRAEASIGQRQGLLEQAQAWPNPIITVQVDDALGLDDGGGGFDMTRLSISQPLPLRRLASQRRQGEAGLASAEAQRRQEYLLLEYKVAHLFHDVQLTTAELKLAKKRLQQARHYQQGGRQGGRHGDVLVRYLTPLEKMRLDIVLQAAQQDVEVAEGEYSEAAASFKALLGLAFERPLQLQPLTAVPTPVGLSALERSMQTHPALAADQQTLVAAQAGVDVSRARRLADPVVALFRETGFYAGRRQDSLGVMLSMELPLLSQNNGRVTQARYAVQQARAELHLQRRELNTDLNKSYVHLGHLIRQAEHYRSKLLKPAKRVFTLTRKGFDAGELNILTLIDANDTYFDAQGRYLELLQQGWLELAELRRAAGVFVTAGRVLLGVGADVEPSTETQSGGVN